MNFNLSPHQWEAIIIGFIGGGAVMATTERFFISIFTAFALGFASYWGRELAAMVKSSHWGRQVESWVKRKFKNRKK